MNIVEYKLDDVNDMVDAMGLVDYPAIEKNWKAFSNTKVNLTKSRFDADQRIITGPAMIPNKLIYRFNQETNEEFYCFFKSDTIRKAANDYLKFNRQANSTLQHEVEIEDTYIFESWLVENSDNDKANELGYDVPIGTWMISMKVDNDEIWAKVKSGEIKGFSIEGYFTEKMDYSKKMDDADIINFVNDPEILDYIKNEFLDKLMRKI